MISNSIFRVRFYMRNGVIPSAMSHGESAKSMAAKLFR